MDRNAKYAAQAEKTQLNLLDQALHDVASSLDHGLKTPFIPEPRKSLIIQ